MGLARGVVGSSARPWLERVRAHGDRVWLHEPDSPVTRRELLDLARELGEHLETLGLRKGDVLAVAVGSSPWIAVFLAAAAMRGWVLAPLAPGMPVSTRDALLERMQATLVLAVPDAVPEASPWAGITRVLPAWVDHASAREALETALDSSHTETPIARTRGETRERAPDEALWLPTSGTTGVPKIVRHGWDGLHKGIASLVDLWRWGPEDVLSLQLPLFHVHGLGIGIVGGLASGVSIRLHERFAPQHLLQDVVDGATIFMGVPAMYSRLLEAWPDDDEAWAVLRGLRLATSGSAPLRADHARQWADRVGSLPLERYGMTETLLTLSNPLHGERRPGSVGFPVPGFDARICQDTADLTRDTEATEGELEVRGEGLFLGYLDDPESTAAAWSPDGWFRTGDRARQDVSGRFWLLGRMRHDFVKIRGWRIGLLEVEAALQACPMVLEVCCAEVSDSSTQETDLGALVVLRDPATKETTLEALKAHAKAVLTSPMRPRRWQVCHALPRNAMGKVDRQRARLLLEAAVDREDADEVRNPGRS